MKKNVHPEYKDTIIKCACGETINTKSTAQDLRVDICSKCHPFFTGQQKFVDSAGMVEKFKKRYAAGVEKAKKTTKEETSTQKSSEKPTIDDVLKNKEIK